MSQKLIVYMIDGVAADHYQSDRRRFPHFAALEASGFRIESLHAEALGTSLPGRTSMLTSVTADVSGVYGWLRPRMKPNCAWLRDDPLFLSLASCVPMGRL